VSIKIYKGQYHEKVVEIMTCSGSCGVYKGSLAVLKFKIRPFKSFKFSNTGALAENPGS
jgi:hypothetical protein